MSHPFLLRWGRGEEGLDSWHLNDAATLITVHVTSTQRVVPCPVCAVFAHCIHLKMLKRQMFGRASLALFGRRFVLVPGRMQEAVQRPLEPSEAQARPAAA